MDLIVTFFLLLTSSKWVRSLVVNSDFNIANIAQEISYLKQQVSALKNESEILRTENAKMKSELESLKLSRGKLPVVKREAHICAYATSFKYICAADRS